MNDRSTYLFLRFVLGLVLLCSLVLGNVSPASAGLRCYVKANATGANNGSSWANAFTNLQSALGASLCTEVWVAKGTYKPTSSTDRTISFRLKNGVAIYGGFAGTETLWSRRNPAANPTILSGEIGAAGISDNSYHVVDGTGTNSTALLDGFQVRAGNADGSGGWPSFVGGGVLNNPGSPVLMNLTISNNWSIDNGAGMFNWASGPAVINVTFRGNSSAASGGGMRNDDGSNPSLANVTFSGNKALEGGGMTNSASSPTLTNVTFSGNMATGSGNGGGMTNYASSPNLMNVTFSGNIAGGNGGGMYNANGSNPTITNSILYGDIASAEIFNVDTSSPVVAFSIILGGYPGTGNLDADPLLKPLGNYGGFTQTRPLGFGSPAIDAGTNDATSITDQRGFARREDGDGNGTIICDMGATESRLPVKSFLSVGTQDGWVLESSETSGVGGTMNASQATFALGDDAADRQGRSILSFNTAGLPDNAVITSVTLKIKGAGVVGTDPFTTLGNLLVDVRKGAFSANAALELQDFQALASKNAAMTILNNPVGGWYSGVMKSANFVYINKAGVTQFRLRFTKDDDDDLGLDYIKFYSGNSVLANRPKLTIQYYMP